MCDALHYLLYNIFIRFVSKLYRLIVGIPMGTNGAPLVANLFLFCSEREPWVCLQFVIVAFPGHTHLLFFIICFFFQFARILQSVFNCFYRRSP